MCEGNLAYHFTKSHPVSQEKSRLVERGNRKMKKSTITGRNYQMGEEERLTALAEEYGVPLDQRNVDTYSDIGLEGWWGPNSVHQGFHEMNPIRGGLVIDLLKSFDMAPPKRIIEIGCGGGIFSEYIARQGYNVLGVDISMEAIKVAKEHACQCSS